MKKILLVLLICLFSVGCTNVTKETISKVETEENSQLKVHFIDVGQGDSSLVEYKGKYVLIDGGTKGEIITKYLDDLGVTSIEYLIATHPHSDHIGGLVDVIKNYEIKSIYMPKVSHTTKTYERLLQAIKEKNLQINTAKSGEKFVLDEAEFSILSPTKEQYQNLNEYSIVLRLDYFSNSFLFTADMEEYNEKDLINANANLKADVLKVAHHGSKSSSSKEFIDKVNPKISVISLGKDNDYKHPHDVVLERLKTSTVYRTDELGSIIISSNGEQVEKL